MPLKNWLHLDNPACIEINIQIFREMLSIQVFSISICRTLVVILFLIESQFKMTDGFINFQCINKLNSCVSLIRQFSKFTSQPLVAN